MEKPNRWVKNLTQKLFDYIWAKFVLKQPIIFQTLVY